MTDLISQPGSSTESIDEQRSPLSPPADDALPPRDGDQPLAWAPNDPAPKKKRLGLWIGLGLGVVVLGAGAASTILIAPGTTIAGVPVGWLTPGAAADAISSRLADTEVELTGAGDGIVLTGADLGAETDAKALAQEAFTDRPLWNVTAWAPESIPAEITLDPVAAERTLRAAVPDSYVDPIDAGVVFDAATSAYVVVPAVPGTAIDLDDLTSAIGAALADGDQSLEFSGDPTEAPATITDEDASATATALNGMLATIGFYVGEERTVPVLPAVAATWLSVTAQDGELSVQADPVAIQATVDTLPGLVNRAPVNAENIVDSAGKVLREQTAGVNGRELGDTSTVASDFAEKLEAGESVFPLTVSETPFTSVNLLRRIEVDLSSQRATLFENGNVVNSWAISSGLPATPTDLGHFRVYAHVRIQDMRGSDYVTEDVPWVTYYNGDEAFHGTYWHNNFGRPMSHGCVNMPISIAKYVYEWSPVGLEVWVHN